jgi:hypothetical protein
VPHSAPVCCRHVRRSSSWTSWSSRGIRRTQPRPSRRATSSRSAGAPAACRADRHPITEGDGASGGLASRTTTAQRLRNARGFRVLVSAPGYRILLHSRFPPRCLGRLPSNLPIVPHHVRTQTSPEHCSRFWTRVTAGEGPGERTGLALRMGGWLVDAPGGRVVSATGECPHCAV